MGARHWTRPLLAATACAVLATPAAADPASNAFDFFGIRISIQGRRDDRGPGPRQRGYQEQAFARGFSDGWQKGVEDRRDRDRYDPARHRDYRGADQGYSRSYGSRDAYRNNYRAGFRQGYEDGYRNGGERWRR